MSIILFGVCITLTASSQSVESPFKRCEGTISTFQIRKVGSGMFSSNFFMEMPQLPLGKNTSEFYVTSTNCQQKNLRAYVFKDNLPKYLLYSGQSFQTRGILSKRNIYGGCWTGNRHQTFYYFTPIQFDLLSL